MSKGAGWVERSETRRNVPAVSVGCGFAEPPYGLRLITQFCPRTSNAQDDVRNRCWRHQAPLGMKDLVNMIEAWEAS